MRDLSKELGPFMRLIGRHWRPMSLGTTFGLITAASAVGLLALSGWFISASASAGLTAAGAQAFNFFYPSIGVRLFALSRTLARYAERVVCHDATFRMLASLRVWFYRGIEPLAPACLMGYRSGDVLNRIVADIDALDNLYLRVLSPSVVALSLTLLVSGFLCFFAPSAALTLTALMAACVAVAIVGARLGGPVGRKLAVLSTELRVRIVEAMQGLPELLVYDAWLRHLALLKQTDRTLIRLQLRMCQIQGMSAAAITVFSGAAVLAVLYFGVGLTAGGKLNGANLALLALTVLAVFETVRPLPIAFQYLGRTREAGRRVGDMVEEKAIVEFPGKSYGRQSGHDVRFDKVVFGYDPSQQPVLRGIDLTIAQGQRVALLGETGAGKSTLASLLVRFWDPTSGRILLGGVDIRRLSESDLRDKMCLISQRPYLFGASIKENLLLAQPDASQDALEAALDIVRLLDFVKNLPEGMDTWIGEAGRLLSGGQARRLAVARAVLRDAPVWVLDEPSEGLDPFTEKQLMQALAKVTENRTVLIITHRLSHVYFTDRQLTLRSGRIVETSR